MAEILGGCLVKPIKSSSTIALPVGLSRVTASAGGACIPSEDALRALRSVNMWCKMAEHLWHL